MQPLGDRSPQHCSVRVRRLLAEEHEIRAFALERLREHPARCDEIRAGSAFVIERVRQVVSPDGERSEERDEIRLDALDAGALAVEARALGYEPLPPLEIEPTHDYVGSTVVILRAPTGG